MYVVLLSTHILVYRITVKVYLLRTVRPGAGLTCWRLSAGCCFRTETPAVRGATRLPCSLPRQNKHLRWPILRCRRPAHKERAAVQPTLQDIADYFQRTSENILILCRVLRPRRICDIYDLFAPFINLLTYLLTGHFDSIHECISL